MTPGHLGLYASPHQFGAEAVARGATALGWRVSFRRPDVYGPGQLERMFDAVIIAGQRGACADVARDYAALGRPVIILDLPRLRAFPDHVGAFVGSLAALPPTPIDGRADALGIAGMIHQRMDEPEGVILVLGQVGRDAAHGLSADALRDRLATMAEQEREARRLPVRYRPHPKDPGAPAPPYDELADATRPLADDLADAAVVVVVNSTGGFEALLAGVPVVCDPSAWYAPWAAEPINGADVEGLAALVASTQFSRSEMATGEPLTYLFAWANGELGDGFDALAATSATKADADLAAGFLEAGTAAPDGPADDAAPAGAKADLATMRKTLERATAADVKVRAEALRIPYTSKAQAIGAILEWYGAPKASPEG